MKQFFYIIALICIVFSAQGQEFDFLNYSEGESTKQKQETFKHNLLDEIDTPVLSDKEPELKDENKIPFFKNSKLYNKVDVSLAMGAQVGVANKDMYFTNSYVAPSMSFKVNNKLSLQAGVGYSYGLMPDYFLFNPEYQPNGTMTNTHSVFAYGSAVYSLTPKTSILASGIVEHQMHKLGEKNYSTTYSNVALGVNYKVTSSFSINAQINYGNNPNYSTTFSPAGVNFHPSIGF